MDTGIYGHWIMWTLEYMDRGRYYYRKISIDVSLTDDRSRGPPGPLNTVGLRDILLGTVLFCLCGFETFWGILVARLVNLHYFLCY